MKFKRGLKEAFIFFDLNKNGRISEFEWLQGLILLGLDNISREEAQLVYRYLDSDGVG